MALVKTFSVGEGDTSYIVHGSDSFTIIDCCLNEFNKDGIIEELKGWAATKNLIRFISTHPDEDHFGGIDWLDDEGLIHNFYVVQNKASKSIETESFKRYRKLRDSDKAFHMWKGRKRKWLNESDEVRGGAGLSILWPDTNNAEFKKALAAAKAETAFNNLSAVIRYSIKNGPSFMWLGDLETTFMETIENHIDLEKTTVVFASHHGRNSGKIPNTWLQKLRPEIVIIGEAPGRHLNYYTGYSTITQNRAGDVTMDVIGNRIDFYVGAENYGKRDWLTDEARTAFPNYIGSLYA